MGFNSGFKGLIHYTYPYTIIYVKYILHAHFLIKSNNEYFQILRRFGWSSEETNELILV